MKTIKRIKEELLALAIPFVEVETGVLATIEGGLGAGKTILLRADIDALELPDATGAAYASKIQDSIMLVDTMVMLQHC